MKEPTLFHGRLQRFLTLLFFPFRKSIERHSRTWKVVCPCGFRKSIWEHGGIRWHASGNPTHTLCCEACGLKTCHTVRWEPAEDDVEAGGEES